MILHPDFRELALQYGQEEAMMIEYFRSKIRQGQYRREEKEAWIRGSQAMISKETAFWSLKQVRRILKSLEEQGAIVSRLTRNGKVRSKEYALMNFLESCSDSGRIDD
ncbi:MAG: hypothetical protein A2600_11750 [Candidatus Lambdaproteobacteria bacterium RIFOXYD1_FULL_56_27]|uniref:Uncharacterized protein n=1 Tax=Candidatus Lambdaproteobacteria bacterium RIFOXYD2_FULL_56_26 TaxID=1817773 RepID=A0A1F6GX82_9PROT|nr:MAG: hypothetical protein A2426_12085 [Candidatus Lambdaproteobacteria bacterium RIFOXYC1_FULL_56_13]OGH02776.1 MAG: hypothetical protein A2557_02870 [Candidatus Lambdaproteobacteria bacterium RIFOXYD2_FULL_56_26]OGH08018.1 MAG: hypothetical protein A2600_11750 [Candidatus Lambdaproteobacteria bacterium RIFOXYD1_FULL_56_27]